MSETSVKIIKNEIRCRDDTVPKTVDTRSHCKVGLRACNNLPQPPPYISVFWGCRRLLHALNHTLQWLLVSTVFGTVSSLHLISFLHLYKVGADIHITVTKCGEDIHIAVALSESRLTLYVGMARTCLGRHT